MPIDPETGLYQEPQGSLFHGGTFGEALKIGNASRAQGLADEAAQRRALALHLADLQGQREEQQLADDQLKSRYAVEAHDRAAAWRGWNEAHPYASTMDKLQAASRFGVDDGEQRVLGNLVVADTNKAAKDEKNQVDWAEQARKEAKGYLELGMTGKDVADLMQDKYKDKVPQILFDKLRLVGVAPMTKTEMDKNKGAANASNARANKDNRTDPNSHGGSDPKTKLEKERDRVLAVQAATAKQLAKFTDDDVTDEMIVGPVKQRYDQATAQLKKIDSDLAALGGSQAALTPPPPPPSVNVKPPAFKPQPAPGKKEGSTAEVTLPDGKKVPGIVRNGMLVPVS